MNILGISCFDHSSAAVLLINGRIIAAAQEERFNRQKYSQVFPLEAINYCLQAGNITVRDLDCVGFYEKPFLKFSRAVINHLRSYPFSLHNFLHSMPSWLDDRLILPLLLEKELGYNGKVLFIKHHLSHAASAFWPSSFDEAAIITADGIGEQASLTIGVGRGRQISILEEMQYPNSLGFLYAAITSYLGFRVFSGEGKVMALAGFGQPVYMDAFAEIIKLYPDGSFRINEQYLTLNHGERMYSRALERLLGPSRSPESSLQQRHYDIAASLQQCMERVLVAIAHRIHEYTRCPDLCLAGGVFLNCVANHKILEETPFQRVFIQPAAGDSGGALGVALHISRVFYQETAKETMTHAFYGPAYSLDAVRRAVINRGIPYRELAEGELSSFVAAELRSSKTVGLFRGRMEFGPRALGHRSILAHPGNPRMRDILNRQIKGRENFRPFAPVVLYGREQEYFELKDESPFMLLAARVRPDKQSQIPSAVHVDGTARIQTFRKETDLFFWNLLNAFDEMTGIPMVLNTSLNVRGQPIVNDPDQAIDLFEQTGLDVLVLENIVLSKGEVCSCVKG